MMFVTLNPRSVLHAIHNIYRDLLLTEQEADDGQRQLWTGHRRRRKNCIEQQSTTKQDTIQLSTMLQILINTPFYFYFFVFQPPREKEDQEGQDVRHQRKRRRSEEWKEEANMRTVGEKAGRDCVCLYVCPSSHSFQLFLSRNSIFHSCQYTFIIHKSLSVSFR